jgi:uncharacterized DUF497 family protein
VAVLEDERALTTRDSFSQKEERWVTLGLDALGRVRVISARMATATERRRYEEADET